MSHHQLDGHYDIGPQIGRGRFGAVFRCTSRSSGDLFAIKSVDKAFLTDPLDLELACSEARLHRLAAAGNPRAVQIHADYEDERAIHLILDLCPRPDLFDRIDGRTPITEQEAVALMADLMKAIAACHRRGVAHRDVKPDNVVFDDKGRLRLADFGSAAIMGGMRGVVGTPYYVAPEVVAGGYYDEKVDVWSAGVVLYVMLGGMPPFAGETAAEIFEAVRRANLRFPAEAFRGVSPAAKDLIRRMICKDASRRFTPEQALAHPWMTDYGSSRSEEWQA